MKKDYWIFGIGVFLTIVLAIILIYRIVIYDLGWIKGILTYLVVYHTIKGINFKLENLLGKIVTEKDRLIDEIMTKEVK